MRRVLGKYFIYLAAILLVPLVVSFLLKESPLPFLETIAVCLILSLMGLKKRERILFRKESIFLVVIIWFLTAAICALPFFLSHAIPNFLDAYFESMSGLTTTGVTILTAPIAKTLLFWRSFLQWFGGLGIVVLFIAVLPALSIGGKFLYESEMTGPSKEGITPRIKETASFLWKVYIGLTLVQIILLLITNVPLFDAITLSFSTISTGGFTAHNLDHYPQISLWIIMLFMILGGMNFSLYFSRKFRDPELLAYLAILLVSSLLLSWGLHNVTTGFFHVISAQTSTGFALVDLNLWPFSFQLMLIILMFVGGMSGSTAGGIKVIRFLIVFKVIKQKIEAFFRPEVVRVLKVGPKEISDKTAASVLTFFCIALFLVIIGIFLLLLDNNDPLTSLSLIATSITNTGLCFGKVGPEGSLAFLTPFSKIIAIIWMVLGRLEFFSLLVLLIPSFWRKTG